MKMTISSFHHCFIFLAFALLLIFFQQANGNTSKKFRSRSCNYFRGSWVLDMAETNLYYSSQCPFIEREFNCLKNGRRDHYYLKYRWQPTGCRLARFNGMDFLRRFRGKKIMFVGDSLSLNQWISLACMLHHAAPRAKYTMIRTQPKSIFKLLDYNISIILIHSLYLVDLKNETTGRALKLDSINGGKAWVGMDMLVFNTWHWWSRRGKQQPFDYFREGKHIYKDMNRVVAFEKALMTWAKWVHQNVNPNKTRVFFQGISPSHYHGSEWNKSNFKTCMNEKLPLKGSTYPAGPPLALVVLKNVLRMMTTQVHLLDVTTLSQLRKDGHPSVYGLNGARVMDCSHWCLPGVPDVWNQILYNVPLPRPALIS